MNIYPERVVLFGSEGGFSRPMLSRLLANSISVVAIVIPGSPPEAGLNSEIPVIVKPSIDNASLAGLAATNDIPVLRTQNIQDQYFIDELAAFFADIFLVACFPLKIPKTIWQSSTTACWNLHPSLLPKYRGPNPLYWQIKHNEQDTGVTLHEVIEKLDAGNIIAQKASALPINRDAALLNDWVSDLGVDLFLTAIEQYRQGNVASIPQDESVASYQPPP